MLLDDNELKELFASLRHIANFFEHTGIKSTLSSLRSVYSSTTNANKVLSASCGSPDNLNHKNGPDIDPDYSDIQAKITLPDNATFSDVASLLHLIINQLEMRIDACLIEFYEHIKRNEGYRLSASSSQQQDDSYRPDPILSSRSNPNSVKKVKNCNLEGDIEGVLILESPESSMRAVLHEAWNRLNVSISQRVTKGRPESSHRVSICSSQPSNTRSERQRVLSSSRRPHDAASIFQNHLYLLLESAVAQTNSSCGAIYLSDTNDANTAAPVEESPRFLYRIADIRAGNRLPQSVSFATINTLTTVVQTGVAVNLSRAQPEPSALHAWGGGAAVLHPRPLAEKRTTGAPALLSDPPLIGRFLPVTTAIVMPIGTIGCVIVANKSGMGINDTRFLRTDEFVVWGLARFCRHLFTYYKTDIFLQHTWAPSAMTCLRQFTILPSVGEPPRAFQLPKMTNSSGRWKSFSRVFSECKNNIEGDRVPKPLVIVQTDVDTIPKLVNNKIERLYNNCTDDSNVINEEEMFTNASEYITNIESLWTQTIKENMYLKSELEKVFKELEEHRRLLSIARQSK
ncbi:unnamed protein product [Phytomonas sp. Hart1]|nr:unnamed protein product [Phytomonas sp. Hart1]|eukprot:CCW72261.1 unnamed protein product [Phytomonas sp. isolate Hart1]